MRFSIAWGLHISPIVSLAIDGLDLQFHGSTQLACSQDALETRDRLNRLIIATNLDIVLTAEVARSELESWQERDHGEECVLGQIALRIAILLGRPYSTLEVAGNLAEEWRIIRVIGWAVVIRSGWPLFQLLHFLQRRTTVPSSDDQIEATAGILPSCIEAESEDYAKLLSRHLSHAMVSSGSSLVASSLAYVARSNEEACPLTVAAAFVAIAWSRLPVYDAETEFLVRQAQQRTDDVDVTSLFAVFHPLLGMLSRLAKAFQMSMHQTSELGTPPDHDVSDDTAEQCVVPFATTPSGNCNAFAPISRDLSIWYSQGIHLEDVLRAFRPVTDQKLILFRLVGDTLVQITPQHSHLDADFGATEPACLAHAILSVLAKADIDDFDMVLNHGDLPILRRTAEHPPFYGPTDREARVPAPLFSICSSPSFWDILFPNVCRPQLVNMSRMSPVPWDQKRDVAFWRGTDRGAVNWAMEISDMYRGSPRKAFLDTVSPSEKFDVAFLEDDLMNATVVNTDPNFVPLDRWPEWRYLLDLPGNGYSGSLKQKLTSTSAVILLTDMGVRGARPVYEHYHAGLQDQVHVLAVSAKGAEKKIQWASRNPDNMKRIVERANRYMEDFDTISLCYIWRLLDQYAKLIRYKPGYVQNAAFGAGITTHTFHIHRRPLKAEATAFKSQCLRLLETHAK